MAGLYEKAESGSETTHRHFIYADGKTIAVHERYSNANPDTTNYLHRDYQGSVAVITNSSGTELERFSYDAFGKRRFDDWTADASDGLYGYRHLSDRAYTGHESLDSTLLTHMNGRVQDPVLGRMISADPTIPYPLSSQSYNRYSYAQNNPMSRVDPSGFGDLKQTECGDVKCFPPIETIGEREEDPFHEMTRDQFVDALRQEIRERAQEKFRQGANIVEIYYEGQKLGEFNKEGNDGEDIDEQQMNDGAEAMAQNGAIPGFVSAGRTRGVPGFLVLGAVAGSHASLRGVSGSSEGIQPSKRRAIMTLGLSLAAEHYANSLPPGTTKRGMANLAAGVFAYISGVESTFVAGFSGMLAVTTALTPGYGWGVSATSGAMAVGFSGVALVDFDNAKDFFTDMWSDFGGTPNDSYDRIPVDF